MHHHLRRWPVHLHWHTIKVHHGLGRRIKLMLLLEMLSLLLVHLLRFFCIILLVLLLLLLLLLVRGIRVLLLISRISLCTHQLSLIILQLVVATLRIMLFGILGLIRLEQGCLELDDTAGWVVAG